MTHSNPADKSSAGLRPAAREITDAVDLCLPDGRLNPDAVGWSRRPLHRCNLRGAWGRKKRWDYWCVTSDDLLLGITYADLDYLGLVTVLFGDRQRRTFTEKGFLLPGAVGLSQPDTVGGSDLSFRVPGLALHLLEEPDATRLHVRFVNLQGQRLRADVRIARPPEHETLNVVVPWSDRRFQFTSKQNTLPATGYVQVQDRSFDLGPENQAFGCLDFGRGIWPGNTVWNWASASGRQQGHTVGLQLGSQWTDGTGQTENGLMLDGRLHKIHEDVRFDFDRADPSRPWRLHTPDTDRVSLDFAPELAKPLHVDLLAVQADIKVCFGRFTGTVLTDGGDPVRVRDLFGWAEEMRARW